MVLITKIREAVNLGELPLRFTTNDVIQWVDRNGIKKEDGDSYAQNSISSILSNSCMKNVNSTNKNKKLLQSQEVAEGKTEYWFI